MEISKTNYVSPKVEVNLVALDNNIMQQSPLRKVDVEDWKPEETVAPDTGDIYIAI